MCERFYVSTKEDMVHFGFELRCSRVWIEVQEQTKSSPSHFLKMHTGLLTIQVIYIITFWLLSLVQIIPDSYLKVIGVACRR